MGQRDAAGHLPLQGGAPQRRRAAHRGAREQLGQRDPRGRDRRLHHQRRLDRPRHRWTSGTWPPTTTRASDPLYDGGRFKIAIGPGVTWTLEPDVRHRREHPLVLPGRRAEPHLPGGRDHQRRARGPAPDVPLLAGIRWSGERDIMDKAEDDREPVALVDGDRVRAGDARADPGLRQRQAHRAELEHVAPAQAAPGNGAEVPAGCTGVYSVTGPGVNIQNAALPRTGRSSSRARSGRPTRSPSP